MKKIIIFIFVMLMVTGCSIKRLDTSSLDRIVDTVLSEKIKLSNRVSKGYKYYLPKGVKLLDYNEYNDKLYSSYNTYYLYVDIVSYHYKIKNNYEVNSNSYYYKELDNNGYVDVIEMNNKYFIKYQYNFAKMEAIVDKNNIKKAIIDMSYILSSIQYNDIVIDSFIGENTLNYSEEKYTIDKPNDNEQTFLDYVNTYDNYKGDETVNEDNDTINNTNQNEELK